MSVNDGECVKRKFDCISNDEQKYYFNHLPKLGSCIPRKRTVCCVSEEMCVINGKDFNTMTDDEKKMYNMLRDSQKIIEQQYIQDCKQARINRMIRFRQVRLYQESFEQNKPIDSLEKLNEIANKNLYDSNKRCKF